MDDVKKCLYNSLRFNYSAFMKTSYAFLFISLCLVLLLSTSCTSIGGTKAEEEEISFSQFPADNRLVIDGIEISLPPEWNFAFPEEDDLFLTFSDLDGYYMGSMEWCPLGFFPSVKEILKYYTDTILKDFDIIRTYEIANSSNRFILMECGVEGEENSFCVSLIPLNLGFYVLELKTSKRSGADLIEVCGSIASTLNGKAPDFSLRRKSGLYTFHNINSQWKWETDFPRGSVFLGYLPGNKPCAILLAVTEDKAFEEIVPDFEEYTRGTVVLPVNNGQREGKAAGRISGDSLEVYLLFEGEKNYIVHIRHENIDDDDDPLGLLSSQAIRSFFLANIAFEGL